MHQQIPLSMKLKMIFTLNVLILVAAKFSNYLSVLVTQIDVLMTR